MFSCEFCEIFKNTFLTEKLQVTASDIRMQVVVIYTLNLSLQFVSINFTFLSYEFSRWRMFQCRLNFCIDFVFGKIIFSHVLQDKT